MRGVLDGDLLNGQHEVSTVLRPERHARPVAVDDFPALLTEMQTLCQVWAGAGQPLVPVRDGRMPVTYEQLLKTEQIDAVGGLQEIEMVLPRRVDRRPPLDYPAILVASGEPRERRGTVHVVDLDPDDPWRPIYNAVLGSWPDVPDPYLLELAGLRQDLRFEEILPISRHSVAGSLGDLIGRLADAHVLSPRSVSKIFLASGLEPDIAFTGVDDVLPQPNAVRLMAGPNVIVAMSPGSVEDVALLWNLRVAHGDRRVLPIGLPADKITPESLNELQRPGRATMFGWHGGPCYITSVSLSLSELQSLADRSPGAVAARYENLLTFGPAPGRLRSHLSSWTDGRTRLSSMSEADNLVLRPTRNALREPRLILDVLVSGHGLPADGTMRGVRYSSRFQAGAAQIRVPGQPGQGTVAVAWPPSWTCLAAVAQSCGLSVAESEPGLAAATLIKSVGSVQVLGMLQHTPLIDLLYRLAERSGMSWYKKKLTAVQEQLVAAGQDPASLDQAAESHGRDHPVVAQAGEGRALPFQEFVKALSGEKAARTWVTWAERRHLLVRGANIKCPDCGATGWIPMASLPPPIGCAGCGRQIEQPYEPRHLPFTFRLGEPLRRVLETDSLGHVLSLRWFVGLFDRGGGLVGAHPGVTFIDTATGNDIGEADVLLLFANGSLVPVEVKRRLAGVDGRTVRRMDALADALDAPYDVLAVTQPGRECAGVTAHERRLPARPRLLLSNDQLHENHVLWALGRDPFQWQPLSAAQEKERETAFEKRLIERDPDRPRDSVSEVLLNPNLG